MKVKKCRICKSTNIKKLFSLGDMCFTGKFPSINQKIEKKPVTLIICKNCELVQLGHNFDLKYLYGPDYGYRTGINKTMLNHVNNVVKNLSKKTQLKKNDLVLDIASNDGSLLKFYKKNIITFGIDPILQKYIKEYKKINYKIADFFSASKITHLVKKKFKIITALSVFYDAADPNKFIKDAKKLLSKDGIFLLEFADLASIIKNKMFDTICHEHLEYYSTKVILNLCKKNNLRIFDIKKNDINGASKQYFICHLESKYKNNLKTIKKTLNFEKKLKLSDEKTFKHFIKSINKSKNRLYKFLKKEKKSGKKIHGYGASTKGNVLLQYYKIDNKMIDFIAERNKNKFNLYTPGTDIKIISEVLSRFYKPDYYLVLPWHFKSEILAREKEIRKKGTKFIFPLPELKII
jgi:2-polyprenyl-3-methyl-5-hydroxy-6-metoxy-1,4-benzoquinol methylase